MIRFNFFSELSFGHKLQIGFLVLMFGLAGYLIYHNTRPIRDMTVTSWVESRKLGADPSRPVGPKNLADPNCSVVATFFACHDGQLEISEFPDNPNAQPSILFHASTFIKTYDFYKSPTAPLHDIADPCRYAVALTAYSILHGKTNLGPTLIARAAMNIDQAKTERAIQKELVEKVDRVRLGAASGIYRPDLRDAVLAALARYKARDGDPTRDHTKAALAWKVIDGAMNYLNMQAKDESLAIEQYTDAVIVLLNADQKERLADAGKLAMASASLKLAADKPSLDATSGLPNVAYVKRGPAKAMAAITDAIHSNDENRVVPAVALVLEVLDDEDFCKKFKTMFESHIDGWLKELISQKRNQLAESLAASAADSYAADESFVALCQERRKLDPGKSVATTGRAPGGKAVMDADGVPSVSYVANSIPKGLAALSDVINSGDDARIHHALAIIDDIFAHPTLAKKANSVLFEKKVDEWTRELLKQKRFDDVDRLALAAICRFPCNLTFIEIFQERRIRAKLAQGKPQDALILAKSFYNVCSISSTSRVADLLCECLLAANKGAYSQDTFAQFKSLQILDTLTPIPADAKPAAYPAFLASIKIDPQPYQKAIDAAEAAFAGVDGILAKGNLLLLADQPTDARIAFNKALAASTGNDKDLLLATEAIARTLRAQDAALPRADSWLQSHRPPEPNH